MSVSAVISRYSKLSKSRKNQRVFTGAELAVMHERVTSVLTETRYARDIAWRHRGAAAQYGISALGKRFTRQAAGEHKQLLDVH